MSGDGDAGAHNGEYHSVERTTLLDSLDKEIMVILQDDHILIGKLRSLDQFNNLVLHDTIERIQVGRDFADIPRGILLVKGETVLLLGDYDAEKNQRAGLRETEIGELVEIRNEIERQKRTKEDLRRRFYLAQGLSGYTYRERFQEDASWGR